MVAGENGLDREVRTVIIGEIPNIQNWLLGGAFIATTVCLMSQQPVPGMEKWVLGLFQYGASALAIKTKRYLSEIPHCIIDLGNKLGFTIIELPESAGQPEISPKYVSAC